MKKLSSSLAAKLVRAFILVAIPPMLIASHLASSFLIEVVNANIESWLDKANQFIFRNIDETREELSATHALLYQRFTGDEVQLSADEVKAFADLGADIVVLRDEHGHVIYANASISGVEGPLYPGSVLVWLNLGTGQRVPAVVEERTFPAWDGSLRNLLLACPFSVQIADSEEEDPIKMRLLLPDGQGGFMQAFASRDEDEALILSPETLRQLEQGADAIYIPGPDLTDNAPDEHVLIVPIRGENGQILALSATSAQVLPYQGLPSPSFVFWTLFLAGTFFSGCVGYVLARTLMKRIASLRDGVACIAAGDLEHRVAVRGEDEIAQLGQGFNLMAEQLDLMQRARAESARAERASMLGEIALGFAHEIRNPLVVIKTSAEVVHQTLPPEAKEARLLGFVVEETRRIDTLVSEFLAFAKPEPLRMQPFALKTLAADVLEMCAPELEKKNIHCVLETGSAEGRTLGQPNQLRQVLLNLIFNAADAMPGGGSLHLRLREQANTLTLDISDTGCGIPENCLETIFTPFMTTKKTGLGLGLAKVRAIIESHGGRVCCAQSSPQGTTFTVTMNLHSPE